MTIALTGATGFVGQAVLDVLATREIPAKALARREQGRQWAGLEWIKGSLGNRDELDALVDGVDTVIHIAGLTNTPNTADFEIANVVGTLELVEAAVAASVPRFIFVSSLSAREPHLSAYGASKAKAEKLVAASGLDWTIVRPPAVYGPRDKDMFELFRAAKWGIVPVPPPGRSSMIHVYDLSELLLALAPSDEDVTHAIFEPDDGREDGWSHREMAKAIGWAMGRHPWVPHLSKPMLERAAAVDRFCRRGKAKLTPDRVGYLTHPDWVVSKNARVPERIWKPRIPTHDGLKATAQWYREMGWL